MPVGLAARAQLRAIPRWSLPEGATVNSSPASCSAESGDWEVPEVTPSDPLPLLYRRAAGRHPEGDVARGFAHTVKTVKPGSASASRKMRTPVGVSPELRIASSASRSRQTVTIRQVLGSSFQRSAGLEGGYAAPDTECVKGMPFMRDVAHKRGTVELGGRCGKVAKVLEKAEAYLSDGERPDCPGEAPRLQTVVLVPSKCSGIPQTPALKESGCAAQSAED